MSVPRRSLATELHAFRSRWPSLRPVRRVAELGWLGRSVEHDMLAQITNQPGFAVSLGSGIGSAIAGEKRDQARSLRESSAGF